MVECRICKKDYGLFHYCYFGDGIVEFPTCKNCFNKDKHLDSPQELNDFNKLDEQIDSNIFRLEEMEKRIEKLENKNE